jgi:nicotinate-nucleotide adenylyltransferase
VIVYPRDQYVGTIDVPLLPVSSTEIRQRVRNNEDISGMVPENIVPLVEKYYRRKVTLCATACKYEPENS